MAGMKRKPQTTWGKIWYFIWHDDSIWSWIVNVILAFVLIKFIVYPALGFVLSTSHPIVAVVSGSMEHDGSFDDWWESSAQCVDTGCTQGSYYLDLGITKEQFRSFRFRNGFNTGDIMILYGTSSKDLDVGDVIVFQSRRPDPIIHRIVKIWYEDGEYRFQTKGDHNLASIENPTLDEIGIDEDDVIGEAVIRLPYLGWIKIGFVKLLNLLI